MDKYLIISDIDGTLAYDHQLHQLSYCSNSLLLRGLLQAPGVQQHH